MEPLSLFTPRASLAALGLRLQTWGVWEAIRQRLQIKQKVRKHQPLDKVLDCFINILAGGSGLIEINLLVRPDVAVQQSVSSICRAIHHQWYLDGACTLEDVQQLPGGGSKYSATA